MTDLVPSGNSGRDDRPPIFRSWVRFYLVLLAELALLIALFWLLSWWAA